MADGRNRFSVLVQHEGLKSLPTTPSGNRNKSATSVTDSMRLSVRKNTAFVSASAASGLNVGKTYINMRYNITESSLAKNRFSAGVKVTGYITGIAAAGGKFGPYGVAIGTMVVGSSVLADTMNYNNELERKQLRFDYINEKFRQATANGSRFGGGF